MKVVGVEYTIKLLYLREISLNFEGLGKPTEFSFFPTNNIINRTAPANCPVINPPIRPSSFLNEKPKVSCTAAVNIACITLFFANSL